MRAHAGRHPGRRRRGPLRRPALAEGDILIVRGDAETVGALAADKLSGVPRGGRAAEVAEALFNRSSGLAEVVIPPRRA